MKYSTHLKTTLKNLLIVSNHYYSLCAPILLGKRRQLFLNLHFALMPQRAQNSAEKAGGHDRCIPKPCSGFALRRSNVASVLTVSHIQRWRRLVTESRRYQHRRQPARNNTHHGRLKSTRKRCDFSLVSYERLRIP